MFVIRKPPPKERIIVQLCINEGAYKSNQSEFQKTEHPRPDLGQCVYGYLFCVSDDCQLRIAFAGSHDCLHLFQFWLQGIPQRDRTQVLFAMESSGVCDFPYLAVTVLLPVQHYLRSDHRDRRLQVHRYTDAHNLWNTGGQLVYPRHGWYLLCVGCDLYCGTEKGKRKKVRTAGPHRIRHFARFCASLLVFCAFTVRRDFPRWLTTIWPLLCSGTAKCRKSLLWQPTTGFFLFWEPLCRTNKIYVSSTVYTVLS